MEDTKVAVVIKQNKYLLISLDSTLSHLPGMLAAKSSLALLRAVLKLQPSDGRSGGRVLEFFASQCSGVAKSLVSGVDDRHLQEKIPGAGCWRRRSGPRT